MGTVRQPVSAAVATPLVCNWANQPQCSEPHGSLSVLPKLTEPESSSPVLPQWVILDVSGLLQSHPQTFCLVHYCCDWGCHTKSCNSGHKAMTPPISHTDTSSHHWQLEDFQRLCHPSWEKQSVGKCSRFSSCGFWAEHLTAPVQHLKTSLFLS